MAITKQKKEQIIEKLSKIAQQAKTVVFVHMKGVNNVDVASLRSDLRSNKVKYTVAKKTLMKRAFDSASIEGSFPTLDGEVGMVYTTDADASDVIAPARGIRGFEKKLPDNVSILGGVFEGAYKTREEMLVIAAIPGADMLRGMFVNVINSPIQGFVIALSEIAKKKA